MDNKERNVLFRVGPDGKARSLVAKVGHPNALAVTADGKVMVFGNNTGELRVYDRDGNALKASAAAVETDRSAAEEEAWADEE
jgi:sugar lactone lactonase YvrE